VIFEVIWICISWFIADSMRIVHTKIHSIAVRSLRIKLCQKWRFLNCFLVIRDFKFSCNRIIYCIYGVSVTLLSILWFMQLTRGTRMWGCREPNPGRSPGELRPANEATLCVRESNHSAGQRRALKTDTGLLELPHCMYNTRYNSADDWIKWKIKILEI